MDLQEWRAKRAQGEQALLPSGLTVTLRKVSMLDLAEQGQIPETLKPMIGELTKVAERGMTADDLTKLGALINVVVAAALVGPAELAPEELPFEDRQAIFAWANEASEKLKLFRPEAGEFVEVTLSGIGVRRASQRLPGAIPL